ELVADATERELSRVQEGQKAEILFSTGLRFAGTVVARARALDPATGLGTVRIRVETFLGHAVEDKKDDDKDKKDDEHDKKDDDKDKKDEAPAGPPPLGSFARATILVAKRDGALVLPASALRGAVADGAEIVLCKAPKVELRTVTVGYRDASRVEIAAGLK